MKNKKTRITYHVARIIVLGAFVFLAIACNKPASAPTSPAAPSPTPEYSSETLSIAAHDLKVEIADTDALRDLGLGGRDSLPHSEGMIFVFPRPYPYPFWMKGMKFPLDFIWVLNGEVVQITHDVPAEPGVPDKQLRTWVPDSAVDSMIEVNAGWAESNGIKVGDTVNVKK